MRPSLTTAVQLLTGRRLAASTVCSTGPADLRRCHPHGGAAVSPVDDISGGGRAYDEPYVPEDLARTLADDDLSHMTDMAGFSEPEQEKFLLI